MDKNKSNGKKIKTLNLHLTNRCNMRCRHCLYSCGEEKIDEMNLQEVKKTIKQFAKISKNKGTINLFGGEIFLRRDIFDIIDYIISLGIAVGITTNANLSQKTIKEIIKRKIDRLSIDINGADPDSHDWLRNKKGHFHQSLKAIKTFIKAGKFTTSNIILHRGNVQEIEKILDLCQKIGINSISCYLFTPLGRGNNIRDLVISPIEWEKTRRRVKKWIDNNSPNFAVIWERSYEYNNKNANLSSSLCYNKSSDAINIRCDGNVYYCCLLFGMNFGCIGNLKKEILRKIITRRRKSIININVGCPALTYNYKSRKLAGSKISVNNIPVCPYDWEILYSPIKNLKNKFAYVSP